ncbi:hypothetical protein MUK42_17326 [Musa troglodytarum]|uniref:Uncharacterized protein n=1 Tax=Musa troglodytarum TaxID=320322 RepID=A0A9E7KJ94_9LILI|nr:hypothetical protein MUK42_17326 [Musa troglodytarum]
MICVGIVKWKYKIFIFSTCSNMSYSHFFLGKENVLLLIFLHVLMMMKPSTMMKHQYVFMLNLNIKK